MEEVAKALAGILAQLGLEGARVWPAMVQVEFTRGLMGIVSELAVLGGIALGLRWALRPELYSKEDRAWQRACVIAGAVVVAALAWWSLTNDLTRVLQPEATLVSRILTQK